MSGTLVCAWDVLRFPNIDSNLMHEVGTIHMAILESMKSRHKELY